MRNHCTSGCSAVRLAHLLWEQGVPSSNLGTPTLKASKLSCRLFCFYTHLEHRRYPFRATLLALRGGNHGKIIENLAGSDGDFGARGRDGGVASVVVVVAAEDFVEDRADVETERHLVEVETRDEHRHRLPLARYRVAATLRTHLERKSVVELNAHRRTVAGLHQSRIRLLVVGAEDIEIEAGSGLIGEAPRHTESVAMRKRHIQLHRIHLQRHRDFRTDGERVSKRSRVVATNPRERRLFAEAIDIPHREVVDARSGKIALVERGVVDVEGDVVHLAERKRWHGRRGGELQRHRFQLVERNLRRRESGRGVPFRVAADSR